MCLESGGSVDSVSFVLVGIDLQGCGLAKDVVEYHASYDVYH